MNPNAPRGLPILGPMRVMPGRLSVSKIRTTSMLKQFLNNLLLFSRFQELSGTVWLKWRNMEAIQDAS